MILTENTPLEVNVYRSTIDGRLVIDIDTVGLEEPDNVIRINLNDGPLWDGDPERGNDIVPLVVMRDGKTFEGEDVEVIDVTALFRWPVESSGYTEEEVRKLVLRLEGAGFDEVAGDIIEHWYGEEGMPR